MILVVHAGRSKHTKKDYFKVHNIGSLSPCS